MADENRPIDVSKEEDEVPVVLDQPATPLSRLYEQLFQVTPPKKRCWPELEGLTAEEAEKKIKEEMPTAAVNVLPQDSLITFDLRPDRVRIFVDSSNKVVGVPGIG